MSDLSSQIATLVDTFVNQVTTLARKAAMETLSSAMGASAPAAGRRGGAKVSPGPSLIGRTVKKGEKRPAAELERVKQSVLEYVTANPGNRVEHIKKDLGLDTRELVLPIKKLIAEGSIRSEGEKRATTYHPAGKRSKKAA